MYKKFYVYCIFYLICQIHKLIYKKQLKVLANFYIYKNIKYFYYKF